MKGGVFVHEPDKEKSEKSRRQQRHIYEKKEDSETPRNKGSTEGNK
jgi:hypothetical protein